MELKTLTWNIGGGKLLKPGDDPTLLASYTVEGLDDIVAKLIDVDPDIIALQEVEGSESTNQIAYIAERLGREHFFYDPTSKSHIDVSRNLGNGIISKYPLSEHRTGFFHNPNVEFDLEGQIVKSHDKGYGQCLVDFNGYKLRTATLHLLPFRRMGIELDTEVAEQIYESVASELSSRDEYILFQGDFNIDDGTVGKYLSTLINGSGLSEIVLEQPTTPKDRKYDHVLFRGMLLHSVDIDSSVATDHYPVICTFHIPK